MKTVEAKSGLDQALAQWQRERPDLDLERLSILACLTRLGLMLDQQLNQLAESTGLNRGLVDVLSALRRAGPPFQLSPTKLFSSLLVTSGCMTHRLDRLEQEGLVERLRDPDDRRGVRVGLTPKGRELIDTLLPAVIGTLDSLLDEFSAEERGQLASLLRRSLGAVEHPRR